MKHSAILPNSAPIARPASPFSAREIAENALNISGAPLPSARSVTPFIKVKELYSVSRQ